MSPVTEIAEEGFPQFPNIPPQLPPFKVTQPEIYFEKTTYVIVNTKQQEFDYPETKTFTLPIKARWYSIDNYPRRIFSWVLRD